jgi:hypothetical protein
MIVPITHQEDSSMKTQGTNLCEKTFVKLRTIPVAGALFFLLVVFLLGGANLAAAPGSEIDQELASAKSALLKGKLQDARDALGRAQQQMAGLGGDAASGYGLKLQKLSASIAAREDSLVNVNLEILRRHGADSAFQYMQDVVWANGVSKEKLDQIENTILNEPPKVNEAKEQDEVAHAVQLLENNKPMDPSIDPYIAKTAEMILQSRADSLKKFQATAEEQPAEERVITPQPIPEPVVEQPPKPAEPIVPSPAVSTVEPVADQKPAPVATVIIPEPKRTRPADKPKKPEEYTSPALLARAEASKEYLKKFKADQAIAQNDVVHLYDMIENGQGAAAMSMFRDQRAFIGKHVSPQVFNVLELTLAQTVIDAQNKSGAAAQNHASASSTPENRTVDRLDALMRQNKVEAAYREFTREELTLKNSMSKKEFKLLKDMIEDAYELRTGNKVKKKK